MPTFLLLITAPLIRTFGNEGLSALWGAAAAGITQCYCHPFRSGTHTEIAPGSLSPFPSPSHTGVIQVLSSSHLLPADFLESESLVKILLASHPVA